jgi:DNA-binding MarR family transcriptional regulator
MHSAGLGLVGAAIKPLATRITYMAKTERAPIATLDSRVPKAPAQAKVPTKSAKVLALLQREQGATLAEMIEATGWQPHTTRASLTGLRKKGHSLERRKRDDATCYHLPVEEA